MITEQEFLFGAINGLVISITIMLGWGIYQGYKASEKTIIDFILTGCGK